MISVPSGNWESMRIELAALHLLALALLVVVALAWGRHGSRRLLAVSGIMTVCAIVVLYLTTVRASDIPIEWITVLQHGLERKSIMHLYTRGAQAGANWFFVVAMASVRAPTLHDVVWLNLLLALVNATIFLHVAVYVAGGVWAIPWTLAFALNPATFLASFSELPSNLLALYFLAAVIAWAVLYDPLVQPRIIRAAACALCAVLTILMGLTRLEVALIGAVALALHAGHAVLGPDAWSAAQRRLRSGGERLLVFFSDHLAVVAVLCLIGWYFSREGFLGWVGRSKTVSVYPFYLGAMSLYAFLPMLALPIGVAIASLFGFMRALVHFRAFGGLALSLAMLANAYFVEWIEYFEMGRYISYILAAIFVLGLFGKDEFDTLVRRRCSPNWWRAARIGYVMAWFTLPLPGVLEYYTRPEYHWSGGFAQLLLDRDTQREVRHVVALTEQNPQCVFVARVVEDQRGRPMLGTRYAYVVFGAPVAQPIYVPEEEANVGDVIARYASGAACVRLYYGGDCNLNFTDHCERFVAGHRLVDEVRFWARPYNPPLESGYGAPEIVLATYEWP